MKKQMAFLITIILFSFLAITCATAAVVNLTSDGSYTIQSTDDAINIAAGVDMTLTGTGGAGTYVSCGAGVSLTLDGVTLTPTVNASPITFNGAGNTLTLASTNTVTTGSTIGRAGIRVNSGVTLTINGSGTLNVTGGLSSAAIGSDRLANYGTIIIDSGNINATAIPGMVGSGNNTTYGGAAIGNGSYKFRNGSMPSGGTIYIYGGNIVARSHATCGSAIGGAYRAKAGVINICGGTVDAEILAASNNNAEGIYGTAIGGGSQRSVSGTSNMYTINISGGTIKATNAIPDKFGGSAIGNSYGAKGGTINISGGEITATTSSYCSAIGGGREASGGTINISGGIIRTSNSNHYASCFGLGNGEAYNPSSVSCGITISGGLIYASGNGSDINTNAGITISGDAAVFMAHDTTVETPTCTTGHIHMNPTSADYAGNCPYGIDIDASWSGALGGYFRPYTLSYDLNGGTGTVPSSDGPYHMGTLGMASVTERNVMSSVSVTAASSSGFSKSGAQFTGWNTEDNGSGTSYAVGSGVSIPFDTATTDSVLYAQWLAVPIDVPKTGEDTSLFYLCLSATALSLVGLAVLLAVDMKRRMKTKR